MAVFYMPDALTDTLATVPNESQSNNSK